MSASRRLHGLAGLTLAQVLASAAAGLILTVSGPAATVIAGSQSVAGWGQTSAIIGAASLSVPVAGLASRRGRRASLVTAFFFAAVGAGVAAAGAATHALALFLFGLAGVGAGTVAALALRYAAADMAETSAARPRKVAIVLASATLGSLIGPNLVAVVGGQDRPSIPFVVVAVLYGCAALVAAQLRMPRVGEVLAEGSAQTQPTPRAAAAGPAATVIPIAVLAAGHMAMIALMGMAPVHLQHVGVGGAGVGAVMSAHLVAMYAASPVFGVLVRRVGSGAAGVVGLVLGSMACGILILAGEDLVGFGVGLACLGLAWSIGMVSSSVALSNVARSSRLRAQGRGDLVLNVGGGLASAVAGLTVAALGYERLAFVAAAVLALVAAGVTVALIVVRRYAPSRTMV
ncbi:MFS transporter [Leifsonia sp. SIMBA_070]|uniref:MFS transporter n=1 Tax=Leifsonia sp. SIMBA_070 TaxID=3085810 RepID=UPI003979CA09